MKQWILFVLLGVLAVILGAFSLSNPFPASLAVEQFVGICFLFIGISLLVVSFRIKGFSNKWAPLLFSVVLALLGVFLIIKPLQGLVALSVTAALLFICSGIIKGAYAFNLQGSYKVTMFISSGASILLGFMVFTGFPASATSILGILLGVELIFDGFGAITMGMMMKNGDGQELNEL